MKKYYNRFFRNIIFFLCFFISIGYSAISTNLKITGDVAFMKAAEIRVIGASLNGVTNSGSQATPVSFDYTSISGGIRLPNLNSTVTITVNTKNYVALDKEITSITNTTFSNSNIEYFLTGYHTGDLISGNASTTFTITFRYKPTVTTLPASTSLNYKLTFNFNNYTLNHLIGNTGKNTADAGYNWLSGPINSLNIETISFTTNNTVPSTAIGSWDVSTKQNGGIMAWYFDSDSNSKYEVVIGSSDGAVLASDLTYFAYYLKNLSSFNASNLNISEISSLAYLFSYAGYSVSSFTVSNIASWNTENITNMSNVFSNSGHDATTWNVGNLGNWDVSNVTDMSYMFAFFGINITTWDIGNLSGWITSNVKNMSFMFYLTGYNSSSWYIGDLSNWNTSSVENMDCMFDHAGYSSNSFNIGNLSNWNVSNVKRMIRMFQYAGYNATTWNIGNIGGWNTSNVTSMSNMFRSSGHGATTWTIGDLSGWTTTSVTDMSSMFSYAGYNATTWNIGNIGGWNTSSVTNMSSMFRSSGHGATTWYIGDLSGWSTSNVINMSSMFSDAGYSSTTCSNIGTLKTYATNINSIFQYFKNYKVTLNIYNNPTNYTAAFEYAATTSDSLITVNYTSSVTNIDNIVATKSSNSNVVKGSLIVT